MCTSIEEIKITLEAKHLVYKSLCLLFILCLDLAIGPPPKYNFFFTKPHCCSCVKRVRIMVYVFKKSPFLEPIVNVLPIFNL